MPLDGISEPLLATFDPSIHRSIDVCVYAKEAVVATVRRSVPIQDQHQVFRGVFEDWQSRAGALSALPGAPVVPDDTRQGRTTWRRLRTHCASRRLS
jgi:hypothetical protein